MDRKQPGHVHDEAGVCGVADGAVWSRGDEPVLLDDRTLERVLRTQHAVAPHSQECAADGQPPPNEKRGSDDDAAECGRTPREKEREEGIG